MTREEFWEIVKKLVQKDYWDAQSVPPKEIKEILTKSILIPKPKFKVGDKVNSVYRDWETDRKSTRLNSSHSAKSRMPSSA